MLPHLALSFAAVLLAADPGLAPLPDMAPQATAEELATQLGHTLGAARECDMGDRADAAMAKATRMVDEAADLEGVDSLDMNDRLHDAIQAGRDAVVNGGMSCDQAKLDLEQIEGQRPY